MGYWSVYFLAKLGLFYQDFIGFHWLQNLVFAIALLCPLASSSYQLTRKALALPIGLSLLYYDSWLPPISRAFSQAGKISEFDRSYLFELIGRYIDFGVLAALATILVTFLLLRHRLRFSTVALLGILSVPLVSLMGEVSHGVFTNSAHTAQDDTKSTVAQDPAALLKSFYATEHAKQVKFASIADSATPFDVIFLHVCSLSLDDMDYVGVGNAPFFNRFDVLFSHFNSAASYSGPAALRLFHSNCGQLPHQQLYQNGAPRCNLFQNFKEAGFEVHGLLNHDGHFDQFATMLQGSAGIGTKLEDNQFAPIAMHSFDNTPILEDLPLLAKWWNQQAPSAKPKVLYYNTISLHDGNRVANLKSNTSMETFKPRLGKLMSDFDQFINVLEARGKPVVVILVPEHGAALRGDRMQISGMREIPNAKITLVPAAVKLVGFKAKYNNAPNRPLKVDRQMSYFALSTLLADFIADSPFTVEGGKPLAERLQNLPSTPFVSENEDIVVMWSANRYQMGAKGSAWVDYQPKP